MPSTKPPIQSSEIVGVSSLSLSSICLKKEAQKSKNKAKAEVVRGSTFTFTEFKKAWDDYAKQKLAQEMNNIAALFSIAVLKQKEDTVIQVSVPSTINKVELENEFYKLKPYLTEQLDNNQIRFEVTVVKEQNKEYLITTQEKYQKLLELNPAIEELRKTLDLDF